MTKKEIKEKFISLLQNDRRVRDAEHLDSKKDAKIQCEGRKAILEHIVRLLKELDE